MQRIPCGGLPVCRYWLSPSVELPAVSRLLPYCCTSATCTSGGGREGGGRGRDRERGESATDTMWWSPCLSILAVSLCRTARSVSTFALLLYLCYMHIGGEVGRGERRGRDRERGESATDTMWWSPCLSILAVSLCRTARSVSTFALLLYLCYMHIGGEVGRGEGGGETERGGRVQRIPCGGLPVCRYWLSPSVELPAVSRLLPYCCTSATCTPGGR